MDIDTFAMQCFDEALKEQNIVLTADSILKLLTDTVRSSLNSLVSDQGILPPALRDSTVEEKPTSMGFDGTKFIVHDRVHYTLIIFYVFIERGVTPGPIIIRVSDSLDDFCCRRPNPSSAAALKVWAVNSDPHSAIEFGVDKNCEHLSTFTKIVVKNIIHSIKLILDRDYKSIKRDIIWTGLSFLGEDEERTQESTNVPREDNKMNKNKKDVSCNVIIDKDKLVSIIQKYLNSNAAEEDSWSTWSRRPTEIQNGLVWSGNGFRNGYYLILGVTVLKDNRSGDIVGYNIWNTATCEEYINIRIDNEGIKFIESSEFDAMNYAFMYNLYVEIKASAECKNNGVECKNDSIRSQIKDVIFSDPATTVIWKDGTKTTVQTQVTEYAPPALRSDGTAIRRPIKRMPFDPEAALAAAIMNKLFGSHSAYAKYVNGYVVKSENKKKKKTKKVKSEKSKSEKTEKVSMTFSERLVAIRKQRGLTQRDLAQLAGMTERTIQRYETADRIPKWTYITKLADALGVPDEALISDDGFARLNTTPVMKKPNTRARKVTLKEDK